MAYIVVHMYLSEITGLRSHVLHAMLFLWIIRT